MHVRNCVCIYACKQTQTHADKSACRIYMYMRARTHARSYYICVRVRTLDRILYTRTQFAQTNDLTTHNSSIWREDSRSGGSSLSRPVGRRTPCAQPGWCRSRAGGAPMGAGTEDAIGLAAAVVLLDLEQALDTWQHLGITFDLFTTTHSESRRTCGWLVAGVLAGAGAVLIGVYKINANNAMPKPYLTVYIRTYARAHACTRTRSIANSTRKCTQSQTHANANKRTQTHRCV